MNASSTAGSAPANGSGKTTTRAAAGPAFLASLADAAAALRAADYARAIRLYARLLTQAPEQEELLGFNLALARRRYRASRRGEPLQVGVCGWRLSENSAGRAQVLAHLHGENVEIFGALFPEWDGGLWPPLRNTPHRCHLLKLKKGSDFPARACEFVLAHPYDLVHISKPRLPNIIFGLLYKLLWGARVVVDVDDEDLGCVGAESPAGLDALPRLADGRVDMAKITGKEASRVGIGLWDIFDAVTVSNPALQARYGGLILPHARRTEAFVPLLERTRASRARFGIPQDKTAVLFFGTARRHKGVVETAQALARLDREAFCFVVAGDIPDEALRRQLQAVEGVDLRLLPPQPYEEIPEVVALGDLCVLLQDPESLLGQYQLPAKLVDALAMGLLVLATRTPALESLIDAGAVVPTTPESLHEDLLRLARDPARTAAIRGRAREIFLEQLSLEQVRRRLLASELVTAPPSVPLQLPAEQLRVAQALGLAAASRPRKQGAQQVPAERFVDEKAVERFDALPTEPFQGERAPMVSIVMPTWNRAAIIGEAIGSLRAQTYDNWELLVCDDGSSDRTRDVVEGFGDRRIRYLSLEKHNGAVARNHGIREARGELLAFLDSDNLWHPSYLARVVAAYEDPAVFSVYTGYVDAVVEAGRIARSRLRFQTFSYDSLRVRNYIDLNTVSFRSFFLKGLGGFDPQLARQQDWDLLLRAYAFTRPLGLADPLVLYRRNPDWGQITETKKTEDTRSRVLEKNRQLMAASRRNGLPLWFGAGERPEEPCGEIAIKVAAPNLEVAHAWGDYHFAHQLGRALYRLGWTYRVDCHDAWYEQPAEVDLVLRGRQHYDLDRSSARARLLWLISHPDRLVAGELESYDQVFVASSEYVKKLHKEGVPARTLLQATDPDVFHPVSKRIPLPAGVIFVGNSRKEFRTLVRWSEEAGIRLAVWGNGWPEFIPAARIAGEHIPNGELNAYYSSCKILLNDHWATMAMHGFISNRLFDASACGCFVISDKVAGLDKVFGKAIVTVSDARELKEKVAYYLKHPEERKALAASARGTVLENHTFAHRAAEIDRAIREVTAARRWMGDRARELQAAAPSPSS